MSEQQEAMRVSKGDLAALSFRAQDALRDKIGYLEGRTLSEGERVVVLIEAKVTRTPSGGLIFGDVEGRAKHGM